MRGVAKVRFYKLCSIAFGDLDFARTFNLQWFLFELCVFIHEMSTCIPRISFIGAMP